jgi:multiple sugar transport system permease protein
VTASTKPLPRATARGRLRKLLDRLEPYGLIAPVFVVLGMFFLGPVLYNLVLSFRKVSFFELARGGTWTGLDNYAAVLRDPTTGISLFNTLFWLTAVTVVLRVVVGLGLALLVNATVLRRLRVSALARSLLLLPWITPPVVAVAAFQWLLHPRYGAVNQIMLEVGLLREGVAVFAQTSTVWWGLVAMIVWREVPFVAVSLLAGLQSIPHELNEAARIDGATETGVFRHVTLPLLAPVISIVTLLSTIWTFNNFLYVWTATRGGPGTFTQVLATQLYTEAFVNYRIGTGAAIGVLMSLVMVVFAVVYFRLVIRRSLRGTS